MLIVYEFTLLLSYFNSGYMRSAEYRVKGITKKETHLETREPHCETYSFFFSAAYKGRDFLCERTHIQQPLSRAWNYKNNNDNNDPDCHCQVQRCLLTLHAKSRGPLLYLQL